MYNGGNSVDFVKKFGEDFVKSFDTLTQTTPIGGVHLLLNQYDEAVRQCLTQTYELVGHCQS